MSMKPQIVKDAERAFRMCLLGMAVPTQVKDIDGQMIQVEKIHKFNRKALKNIGKADKDKIDPRYLGGEDTMIVAVGKPGSPDRVEELTKQYGVVERLEISPWGFKE